MPDLVDFFLYGFRNATFKVEKLGFDKSIIRMNNLGIKAIEWMRGSAKKALIESKHFTPTADIWEMKMLFQQVTRLVKDGS